MNNSYQEASTCPACILPMHQHSLPPPYTHTCMSRGSVSISWPEMSRFLPNGFFAYCTRNAPRSEEGTDTF